MTRGVGPSGRGRGLAGGVFGVLGAGIVAVRDGASGLACKGLGSKGHGVGAQGSEFRFVCIYNNEQYGLVEVVDRA